MQRRVVQQQPVRVFAVLAERLAVIGGQRDQRVAPQAAGLQPGQQLADHRIHVRDLAVVGRRGVA